MSETYFALNHLTVGYQGHPVVEDINVSLKKGEILTLIGPNGAGKSTILKTIVGQLPSISGSIEVEHRNIRDISGSELSKMIAVVLTEKLKTELMTCEDVVATGRYPYTGRFGKLSEKDYQIVEEAMDLVHVTAIKDRDFMRISDGQRQRVMLARAICQEPDIIILDEPTSFLDVKYKLEFLSVLQQLRAMKNLTVIMSIHELELAERVSDKILCVNGIHIDGYGTAEEIFRPGYITGLFQIKAGTFDESNTSMELKALQALEKRMETLAYNGADYDGECFIAHSDCLEDAGRAAGYIRALIPKVKEPIKISYVGSVIGSHTGPGAIVLSFWGEKRIEEK